MRAVWLIGTNVVREQRWFILLMLLYLVGITGTIMLVGDREESDTLLVFRQETVYGIFFSVVIGLSIFQNDRKTRRILAVLSKAVARREYVAGVIAGVNLTTLIYFVAVYGALFVMFPQARMADALGMMLSMVVAGLLASVVTVLYATCLHPLLATTAAGATLGLPMLLERVAGPAWANVLPVYSLVRAAMRYTPESGFAVAPGMLALALGECVALWAVASWIFSLRDVTTTVE
jgi:hypothetical protein